MKDCKICSYADELGRPCELDKECPLETSRKLRIETENQCQKEFLSWSEDFQLKFIHEYRKLQQANVLFGEDGEPFDTILDALEYFLPSHAYEKIHDENGDINLVYYDLLSKAVDNELEDECFLKHVLEVPF